jgi:hypothetical protein
MSIRSLEYREHALLPTEHRGSWTVVICRRGKPQAEATKAETYFEAVWQAKRLVDAVWDAAAPGVDRADPVAAPNVSGSGAVDNKAAVPSYRKPAPAWVRDGLDRTLRRRLADRLEDLFRDVCIAGDFDTAEELLAAMGRMRDRRAGAGVERRLDDDVIPKARDVLDQTKGRLSGRVV